MIHLRGHVFSCSGSRRRRLGDAHLCSTASLSSVCVFLVNVDGNLLRNDGVQKVDESMGSFEEKHR